MFGYGFKLIIPLLDLYQCEENLHFNKTLKKEKEKTTTHPVTSTSTASFHCYIWCVFLSCFSIYSFVQSVQCQCTCYLCEVCMSEWVSCTSHTRHSLFMRKKRFLQTKINGETECFLDLFEVEASVFFQGGPCVCVSPFTIILSVVSHKKKTNESNGYSKIYSRTSTRMCPTILKTTWSHIHAVIHTCRNKNTHTGAYNTISREGIKEISNKYK